MTLLPLGNWPEVASLKSQSPCIEGIGLWHALRRVTSVLFFFYCLFACLSYLSAATHYDRLWSDGRSTGALNCITSPWVGGRRRGHHPAPHRMPFNKRSFFLAAMAIELALLLGYGGSQYTGNCTNVINTTFGGAVGDTLDFIVAGGTVFPRSLSLPRGIVMVSIR